MPQNVNACKDFSKTHNALMRVNLMARTQG